MVKTIDLGICRLVFLFGLPLFFIRDDAVREIIAGLCAISLGGFAAALALDGVINGSIKLQFSEINRSTQTILFWGAVGLVATAGVGMVVAGVWVIFFKA